MEGISVELEHAKIVFYYVSSISVIILALTFVKLAFDISNLARSLQNLSTVLKHELEPTIKELQRTLGNVNSIASSADKGVHNLNKTIEKGLGSVLSSGIFTRAKIVSSSLMQGILTGIKVFTESRK